MSDTGYKVENYDGTTTTTDLVDIFQPLSLNATYKAAVTGYIAINGKDLNEIFQPLLPFTTTGADTIAIFENGIESENMNYPFAMVTYTYASTDGANAGYGTFTPLIDFAYASFALWYTACGGGGGGGASNVAAGGGGGGGGGGGLGGNIPSLFANTETRIFIGKGGLGTTVSSDGTSVQLGTSGGDTTINENVGLPNPVTTTCAGGQLGYSTITGNSQLPNGGNSYLVEYPDGTRIPISGGLGHFYNNVDSTSSSGGGAGFSGGVGNDPPPNPGNPAAPINVLYNFYSSGNGGDGYNSGEKLEFSSYKIPFFVGGGGGGGGGGNLGNANRQNTSLNGLGGKGGGGNGALLKGNYNIIYAQDGTTGGGGGGGTSGGIGSGATIPTYLNGGNGGDGIAVFIIKL